MPLQIADRVKESTTTTGTGTVNLAGAVTGYQSFVAGIGNGNQTYYAIAAGSEWEIGIGTVTSGSPDNLSRTTVLASSNSNALVSFSAGSKDVWCDAPASFLSNQIIRIASAGGTANAITATYVPPMTALTDKVVCMVIAGAANSTTTPTFAPDGLTAHTITARGGGALKAGDIPGAGFICLLQYNLASTVWELMNPEVAMTVADRINFATYSNYSATSVDGDLWFFANTPFFKGRGSGSGTVFQILTTSYVQNNALAMSSIQLQSTNASTTAATNIPAGDNSTKIPPTSWVQSEKQFTNLQTGGGTVDAITATYSPALTLTDGTICFLKAAGANTVTNPTFAPNSLTAHTITKNGNKALAVGDIYGADHVLILMYNSTNAVWELLNPAQLNENTTYKTILQVAGSHIAAKIAGTYAIPFGDPLAVSGTGTLYPIGLIQIKAADYPAVNGKATKLRIRAIVNCNDVAPTGNFTIGLYPVTRPGTSGGTGLNIYTIGTVVAGSNGATVSTPAADSINDLVGSEFALPSDGIYCLAVVTTATVAVSSLVHVNAQLQMRNP